MSERTTYFDGEVLRDAETRQPVCQPREFIRDAYQTGLRAGVEAAIQVIEVREQRVHHGAGGALQADRTIAEIRERLLNG